MTLYSDRNSASRRALLITLMLAGATTLSPAFAQNAAVQAPTDPVAMPQASVAAQESTPAPQATAEPTRPADFKQLDTNKDGKLSREELAGDATWTADFDAADTNKDGYLSKAEFKKHESELRKVAKVDHHG